MLVVFRKQYGYFSGHETLGEGSRGSYGPTITFLSYNIQNQNEYDRSLRLVVPGKQIFG